jgi:hypothetical protein
MEANTKKWQEKRAKREALIASGKLKQDDRPADEASSSDDDDDEEMAAGNHARTHDEDESMNITPMTPISVDVGGAGGADAVTPLALPPIASATPSAESVRQAKEISSRYSDSVQQTAAAFEQEQNRIQEQNRLYLENLNRARGF